MKKRIPYKPTPESEDFGFLDIDDDPVVVRKFKKEFAAARRKRILRSPLKSHSPETIKEIASTLTDEERNEIFKPLPPNDISAPHRRKNLVAWFLHANDPQTTQWWTEDAIERPYQYVRGHFDSPFDEWVEKNIAILDAAEKGAIEEIRKNGDRGWAGRFNDVLTWFKRKDPTRFERICRATILDKGKVNRWALSHLIELAPHDPEIAALAKLASKQSVDKRFVPPHILLLQKSDPIAAAGLAIEFIEDNEPTKPILEFIAKNGAEYTKRDVLERLKKMPFDSESCDIAFELGSKLGIEFYEWAFKTRQPRADPLVGQGISGNLYDKECYRDDLTDFMQYALDKQLGCEPLEFITEVTMMAKGQLAAANELMPMLVARFRKDCSKTTHYAIANCIGRLKRRSEDKASIDLLAEYADRWEVKRGYVVSVHSIGGAHANQSCCELWKKVKEKEYIRYQDLGYCQDDLSNDDLIEYLKQSGHNFVGDAETYYQETWDDYQSRSDFLYIIPPDCEFVSRRILEAAGVGYKHHCEEAMVVTEMAGLTNLTQLRFGGVLLDANVKKESEFLRFTMLVNGHVVSAQPRSTSKRSNSVAYPLELVHIINALLKHFDSDARIVTLKESDWDFLSMFGKRPELEKLVTEFHMVLAADMDDFFA